MPFLTAFALTAVLVTLSLGIFTTLAESGYSFDLRRMKRRGTKDGRSGGRRANDHRAAA